jgi:hypothetical protein
MFLIFVLSLVLTHFSTFGRMEHQYSLLEEEYEKEHQTHFIEAGQVT